MVHPLLTSLKTSITKFVRACLPGRTQRPMTAEGEKSPSEPEPAPLDLEEPFDYAFAPADGGGFVFTVTRRESAGGCFDITTPSAPTTTPAAPFPGLPSGGGTPGEPQEPAPLPVIDLDAFEAEPNAAIAETLGTTVPVRNDIVTDAIPEAIPAPDDTVPSLDEVQVPVLNVPVAEADAQDDHVAAFQFLLPAPEPRPTNGRAECLLPVEGSNSVQWFITHDWESDQGQFMCTRCFRPWPE